MYIIFTFIQNCVVLVQQQAFDGQPTVYIVLSKKKSSRIMQSIVGYMSTQSVLAKNTKGVRI